MNYLIPTIDVEALRSLSRLGDFDQLILGKIGKENYGTIKIAEIIKKYGGSGTFYIDFAEKDHGIDKLKLLSEEIMELGSDVQLHIHPQFLGDKNRYLMNHYTKEEQSSLIDQCIDIFAQCTGENPLSFRAGGYGADDNTIDLLREKGIRIDSSFFVGHKWCKINDMPINRISEHNSLIELPVTVFENRISYRLLGMKLRSKSMIKKLDIDGCSKVELEKGFNSLKRSGVRIIILFLHSFSLFNRSYDYSKIEPDFDDIEKLEFILEHASNSDYKISSIKEIKDQLLGYVNDPDVIPQIDTNRSAVSSSIITFNKYVKRKLRGK